MAIQSVQVRSMRSESENQSGSASSASSKLTPRIKERRSRIYNKFIKNNFITHCVGGIEHFMFLSLL